MARPPPVPAQFQRESVSNSLPLDGQSGIGIGGTPEDAVPKVTDKVRGFLTGFLFLAAFVAAGIGEIYATMTMGLLGFFIIGPTLGGIMAAPFVLLAAVAAPKDKSD